MPWLCNFFACVKGAEQLLLLLLVALLCLHDLARGLSDPHGDFRPLRRTDADPIGNKFDINVNSIILTKESRLLGGAYINETELNTNDECLAWCWKISSCNVAVFEEITKRSCFLFDCGPPADFRCKFMFHKYYTSSVLKTQHSYDLKQWGREVKKENAMLFSSTTTLPPTTSAAVVAAAQTVTTVEIEKATTLAIVEPNIRIKPMSRCRHYQFQCFNSSECIAIYNVCDGIPQCPDGSDESPDLQCPSSDKPSAAQPTQPTKPAMVMNPPPLPAKQIPQQLPTPPQRTVVTEQQPPPRLPPAPQSHSEQQLTHPTITETEQLPPPSGGNNMGDGGPWPESFRNQDAVDYDHAVDGSNTMRSPFTHKHSTFMAANSPQYISKWQNDYEQYPQQTSNLDQQYNLYEQRLEDQYPKGQQYSDYERTLYDAYRPENSPLWVDQERLRNANYLSPSDYSQSSLSAANRQSSYPVRDELVYQSKQMPSKNDPPAQYMPMDKPIAKQAHRLRESNLQNSLPDGDNRPPHHMNKNRLHSYSSYLDMPRTDYRPYSDQIMDSSDRQQAELAAAAAAQIYGRDEAIRESLTNQLRTVPGNSVHMYEPIAEVLQVSSTPAVEPTQPDIKITDAPPKMTTEHPVLTTVKPKPKTSQPKENQLKISAAERYQAQSIRIHESNNAIVALTLGLIITGLLLLLVGCRLKTIRRRSTRRGRPLAHDADYLVNGLYL